MKVKKFKTLFFIPLIYIFLLSIYIAIGANGGLKTENGLNKGMIYGIAGIFILLHLFSMFGIFYTLYFVSKTFKTIELQRKVEFSDFAGEFLMLWFYPIGIWIIQPKINKMIEKNNTTANNV